ncbi:hypothetical protein [Mesorhizobium sp. M0408]|uniref:hypothetical protein n=1 Tax=Mesorhizobium sp. M0408 TaxID=2956942 RepID=UPI0033358A06
MGPVLQPGLLNAKATREKPQGYVIQSTGEVAAYGDKRVKNSPDGEYHWCSHLAGMDAGHTICLFCATEEVLSHGRRSRSGRFWAHG